MSSPRWLPGLVFAGVATFAGCGDLLTGEGEAGKKNYAVIVGISTYQSQSLNLKWADEDALDVYDALRRGKNWETDKITLLTNASATREGIKSAIAGLAKRVGTDDQVVFYFSGRGSYSPDQPPFDEGDGLDEFLVPYDALPNSPAQDLSDDELEALFSSLPTNNVMIVLDAGFAPRSGSPTGREKNLVRAVAGGARAAAPRIDGMGRELARPGYLFLTASQPGEAPTESNQLRNGVFTYYFAEGLRGAAAGGKKTVSAQQAYEYAVTRAASTAGQAAQLLDNRGKGYRVLSF